MNEMTTEDRAKCFALYLGSECRYYDDAPIYMNKTWCIRGIDANCFIDTVTLINKADPEDWFVTNDFELVKLSLYDLSDITDEDCKEICRIAGYAENERLNIVPTYYPLENVTEIIDFLRSRSYMLPYRNVDLFEAGIAERRQKCTH